jgi:tetratricopeptide (TPR) repeat protein
VGVLLLLSACRTSGQKPAASASPSEQPFAEASWPRPYSPEQQALLAPVDVAIRMPAMRTYPDLERFGYSPNRRMGDVREGLEFTKMVAEVLRDSPRFYVLSDARPELANLEAQYGPASAPEADGFQRVDRGADGLGVLHAAEVSEPARAAFERGVALLNGDKAAEAVLALRDAATKGPDVPAFATALADALARTGDVAGAEAAYRRALGVDPTYATAHRGLAELLFKRGDVAGAQAALAEALAWYPPSLATRASADRMAVGGGAQRVQPYAVFFEVDAVGAVHVASSGGDPGAMYASCRAVLRYEPELRSAIFRQPPSTPYYLSMAEEIVCLEAAMGAYVTDRLDEGSAAPDDPALEALLTLAKAEGLSGYVMFEILGMHRPERARTAPADVHQAMVDYVKRYVLAPASTSVTPSTHSALNEAPSLP